MTCSRCSSVVTSSSTRRASASTGELMRSLWPAAVDSWNCRSRIDTREPAAPGCIVANIVVEVDPKVCFDLRRRADDACFRPPSALRNLSTTRGTGASASPSGPARAVWFSTTTGMPGRTTSPSRQRTLRAPCGSTSPTGTLPSPNPSVIASRPNHTSLKSFLTARATSSSSTSFASGRGPRLISLLSVPSRRSGRRSAAARPEMRFRYQSGSPLVRRSSGSTIRPRRR